MKILIISDTHNNKKYLDQAFTRARERKIDVVFHLGDLGSRLMSDSREFYLVPGNHDLRHKLSRCPPNIKIVEDCILNFGEVIIVTKGLGCNQVASVGYEKTLTQLIFLSKSFGKPVVLLSHCGGKTACHRRFLRMIEGGHSRTLQRMSVDLEIHGHKHVGGLGMYLRFAPNQDWWQPNSTNLAQESATCWNAAHNILLLDTKTLEVTKIE